MDRTGIKKDILSYLVLNTQEVRVQMINRDLRDSSEKKKHSMESVFRRLPEDIARSLRSMPRQLSENLEEIRFRIHGPVTVCSGGREYELTGKNGRRIDSEEMNRIFSLLIQHSRYAYQEEIRRGFFTMEGGHRVGICGHAVMEGDEILSIQNITSINIRRGCEYPGTAESIIPYLMDERGGIRNTILLSPPRCGKTTVLRDITRLISLRGKRVGVCDERSEIAGCSEGIPSFDIGPRTDVMDGCPKAKAMTMLIRSMAPEVLVADELGTAEDAEAVEKAAAAGVSVIASIHGRSFDDLLRSSIGRFVRSGLLSRIVLLGADPVPGTVQDIVNASNLSLLSDSGMHWRTEQ